MYLKNLKPGDKFSSALTRGCVYSVVRVVFGDGSGYAEVEYEAAGNYRGRFSAPGLSWVSVH